MAAGETVRVVALFDAMVPRAVQVAIPARVRAIVDLTRCDPALLAAQVRRQGATLVRAVPRLARAAHAANPAASKEPVDLFGRRALGARLRAYDIPAGPLEIIREPAVRQLATLVAEVVRG